MKKYLNQTTVNVIAIATAVVAGFSIVGVSQGPDRAMKKQILLNRQLDYDLARLKNCGELKKFGIEFHQNSPMAFLCADVVVTSE
tara:strand:- start:787 stop:1041 length:255 start_codon:yes stop_codon:yes gene_type:complete